MDGPFVEFMNYLGVTSDKLVRIEKPSSFRNIIIPKYCTKSEQFYHPLYIEIFNRVVENSRYNEVNTYQNRKIYFSRSKFIGAKQKDFGENYIQPVFEKNGYVKTYPETLSLKEQSSFPHKRQ
jgi:capsular polysaccharide biosynthesis protein